MNILDVTVNMIIFTSLGCVISQHNVPNHPKDNPRNGLGVSGITSTRIVGARKQAGCWRDRKVRDLCLFGIMVAV
jgi:hypothetical protein